jgi:predicted transcriptional regulator
VGPAAAPSPDATAPPVVPLRVATAAALLPVALGAALYSRFHGRPGVLRSGTRERLVGVVRLHPGVSVTDAAGLMGLARNAVQHHVRLLERVGIVRVEDARGRKALYLRDAPPSDAPPAWLLKNAACAAVVRALHERPEGLPREAVHGLMKDLPERTRNYNIQKLLAVGVMEQVETPGGRKVLRATRPACGG